MNNQYTFHKQSYKPKTQFQPSIYTEKGNDYRLYQSEKYVGSVSENTSQNNQKLTSQQIMTNLNSSFDGLFSKIQALKQGHNLQTSKPSQVQKSFKKNGDLGFSVKYQHKPALQFTQITQSTRLPRSPNTFNTKIQNLIDSAQFKKPQKPKFNNPFQEISAQKKTDQVFSLNSSVDKSQNAFYNSNQIKTNNLFMKTDKFMGIPSLKASVNFPDQQQYENSRPTTSESKLDAVVQKMAGINSRKAIKQSIVMDCDPNDKKIFRKFTMDDFELGKCVGSGKFGDVFICRHKQTGFLFALKKIFKSTILQYDMITQFTRQLRIHYILNHPNIIKLYSHFEDQYHIFLLMEYAEGGILMDRLKCSQDEASRFVSQAIDAVQYLHNHHRIAHRDIKPQNIVLQFGTVIKLCDFGWSSFYSNEMKTTFCGTLDYLSPQMKQKGVYDNSVDIWSIGVLTYQLLVGSAPFQKQINNWKRQGSQRQRKWNWNIIYPVFLSTISESFMRNLLKQKPQQRSTLRFSANHMFIRKYQQTIEDSQYYEQFSKII